ncbi:MAG: magnesium/cobalt transporter CorA [Myxococcota bacterium]
MKPASQPKANKLGQALGWALGGAAQIGRAVTTVLRPAGSTRTMPGVTDHPGAPPGIEHLPDIHTRPDSATVQIRVMDYAPDRLEERELPLEELEPFLAQERPEWVRVRWIDLDGLHPWVIERIRITFGIHPLAAEDVLHVPQRPGVDTYGDHAFVKSRVLMLEGQLLATEQISMFLFPGTLVTLQERPGDVWAPVRDRLRRERSRARRENADFLLYALLDAIVDHCFPLLERYGELLVGLEEKALEATEPRIQLEIQHLRRELVAIRRVLWPTREMVDTLMRQELPAMTEGTQVFLRDVYSHVIQLLEIVESQREMCAGLSDLYMSSLSTRMNEVMKVLTIMASLFIPVTFLAGVYGMNFEHIPELRWPWAYGAFWVMCIATTLSLLIFFKRKGWL